MSWRPSAHLESLKYRAQLYRQVRAFFWERQILEVDVPLLSPFATVDPFIESLQTTVLDTAAYLQTSPEFFLKRFLAAEQHDCYYLGKAFRQGERGERHNPEFTMLEWYRVGWDEQQLITEVRAFLGQFLPDLPYTSISYGELFKRHTGINPHSADIHTLKSYAHQQIDTTYTSDDINNWLDIVFSHCIEPHLQGLYCVYDYPASQAALARVEHNSSGSPVARRFEFYVNGLELANGYWELANAQEQKRRFLADDTYRLQHDLPRPPYDRA